MNISFILKQIFCNPSNIIEEFLRKSHFAHLIGDKTAIRLFYYLRFRSFPNLKSPKTFNEKLLWLTLHDRKALYNRMVDKYEAKLYMKEVLLRNGMPTDVIVPTFGVYSTFEEIDFSSLPEKFVMKTTHDSGGVVIVRNKQSFDKEAAKAKLEKSLLNNYFWFSREWAYKDVRPRIIIEEFIESTDLVPPDYKFYCFNGEPKLCLYIGGRFQSVHEDYFDMDWKRLKFTRGGWPAQVFCRIVR